MGSVVLMSWVLAGAVPALPVVPEGPGIPWSQPNSDATYVATQTATATGCHLRVTHDADQAVLWESDGCFGAKADLEFLSRDGKRLIVVASFPPAAGKDAAGWRQSPVAWLFEKGVLLQSAVAGQFVKADYEVRKRVSHFSWLQGVDAVPGVPPHYSDDGGSVELDAIDGTHASLSFGGFKLPAPYRSKSKKHKHSR